MLGFESPDTKAWKQAHMQVGFRAEGLGLGTCFTILRTPLMQYCGFLFTTYQGIEAGGWMGVVPFHGSESRAMFKHE